MDPIEKFHAHLDLCEQCREHPFDLCIAGAQLLVATAGPSKPFSMSATTTGRIPSAVPFQSAEPKTEFGKAMRDAVKRGPLGGAIRALDIDFSALERQMLHEFHEFHKDHKTTTRGCLLCDAGVPFEE